MSKDNSLNQIFANNLRKKRKGKKLSQEELADLCQLHRTYIGSVERGERNITLSTLERIAASLNIDACELLTE
jgi:transcriptional regulator with XRE-family HTH domain